MNTRIVEARKFQDALKLRDDNAAVSAVNNGADLNALVLNDDYNALHSAVRAGNKRIVQLLLDNGADVECCSSILCYHSGGTALYMAAKSGNIEILKLLLSHQANVNAKCSNGDTPVSDAAARGDTSTVKLLLEHGAEVTQHTTLQTSPLFRAVTNKHPECVELIADNLIKKFKDNPDALYAYLNKNREFNCCLINTSDARIFAALFKLFIHCLTSKVYIDNLWVLLPNPHGMKALYTESIISIAKALPLTVRAAFCVRLMTGYSEFTPHLCIIHRKCVDELNKIHDSTDINFLKKKLYQAAKSGDIELAKICIKNGAPINEAVNWFYDLPIYVAAENGHAEMVAFLIDNGADKDHRRTTGLNKNKSIAHAAAENGHIGVLQVLFDKDNLKLKDEISYTVLLPAIENNHIDTVKFLLEHDVLRSNCRLVHQSMWFDELLLFAVRYNRIEILAMITDTILTWPIQNIIVFLDFNLFRTCMLYAIEHQSETFASLLRICEHLVKNGIPHDRIIKNYIPALNEPGIRFKKIILEQASTMTDEEASVWLGRILDPNDYLHHLASVVRGLTYTDVENKGSTLYKAAEQKKEIDARIAANIKNKEIDEHDLYTAAANGDVNTLKLLIDKGTDINCNPDSYHAYPLLAAVANGRDDCVKLLLEKGVDITPYVWRSTALQLATEKGHLNIVNLILASVKPCDAFAKRYQYGLNAALFCAAAKGHLDIVNNIIHFMIYHFDADQIYSFLKDGNFLRSTLENTANDEIKKALYSLTSMLRKMDYTYKDINPLLDIKPLPRAESVAVAVQPAAPIVPAQIQNKQSAVEMAFSIDVMPEKLPNPLAPAPLSVLELAFTSVNIPHNLPDPMVPEKLSSTAVICKQIGLPTPLQPVRVAEQVLPVAPQVNPRAEVKIQAAAQQETTQPRQAQRVC